MIYLVLAAALVVSTLGMHRNQAEPVKKTAVAMTKPALPKPSPARKQVQALDARLMMDGIELINLSETNHA
ncbi:hypothetical protein [Legionella feeleii]|uniref:Uncharacterized protein n=1 Tax=Legionella feeleii TaxID=453 RepID=A0A0W0TGY3_9GAMM|nr:hypothetical protein [Legionella feeleii]KTC94856.1 hypothetical protein Lfee_2520 [Legionella feeleii]SPX62060.1 Uncharacterised protein [Legionella feeleii]